MVIPGHPDDSNIMVLIDGKGQLRMPYGHKPLPSCFATPFTAGFSKAPRTIDRV